MSVSLAEDPRLPRRARIDHALPSGASASRVTVDRRSLAQEVGPMTGLDRVLIEQAKGALMLRYGIGSSVALASLVRWSQETNTSLDSMARILLKTMSHGDQRESHDPAIRWLDERLRHKVPDIAIPDLRLPADND